MSDLEELRLYLWSMQLRSKQNRSEFVAQFERLAIADHGGMSDRIRAAIAAVRLHKESPIALALLLQDGAVGDDDLARGIALVDMLIAVAAKPTPEVVDSTAKYEPPPHDLRLSRLQRLHNEFNEAAERYPDLVLFAACDAECLDGYENHTWPLVPVSDGTYIGIPSSGGDSWRELLDLPRAGPTEPKRESFVVLEDRIWHAGIFDICPPESLQDDRLDRHKLAMAGVDELLGLARSAYGNLATAERRPCPVVDFPRTDDDVDRWLEFVLAQSFIEVIGHGDPRFQGYVIRRTRGDIFTASAMAIESMLDEPKANSAVDEATPQTEQPADDAPLLTDVQQRNDQFLHWNETDKLTPAKIRDRWNKENPSIKIAKGTPGRDLVKKSITEAKGRRDSKKKI